MKALLKTVLVVVVLIAAAIAGTAYYLDTIAKKAIELAGKEALGVTTRLDSINISLLDGTCTLSSLDIANPGGFSSATFMGLNTGEVAVDVQSLLSDTVTVSRIQLSGLTLNLEQSGQSSNVKTLLGNLPKPQSTTAPASPIPSPTAEQTASPGKRFIIKQLVLEDIAVNAQLAALGSKLSTINLTVPEIKLNDIGQQQGGITLPQLIELIVTQVLNATANSSASLSPALAGMLKGDLKNLDSLKSGILQLTGDKATSEADKLLKQLDGLPAGSDQKIQEETDKLLQGIQGLLNKK